MKALPSPVTLGIRSLLLCIPLIPAAGLLRGEARITILSNPSAQSVLLWWLPGDPSEVLEKHSPLTSKPWIEVDQNHANGHEASTAGIPANFFRLRSGGSAESLQISEVSPPAGKPGTAVEITGRVTGGRRPYDDTKVDLFGLNIEPLVMGGRFRARVMIPINLPLGNHPFGVSIGDSSNLPRFAYHSGVFTVQPVDPLKVVEIAGPTSVQGGSTTKHTLSVTGGIGPMTCEVPSFIGTNVIMRRLQIDGASLNFNVTWGTGLNTANEVPVTVTDRMWLTAVGGMFYEITHNPAVSGLDAWGYPLGYPFGKGGDAEHPDGYDGFPGEDRKSVV